MIHPGTYIQFGADVPQIQEVPGTIAFTPFISQRYIDNEMLFAGSLNLDLFGDPNKVKYTQGLYNARNFHEISTWLYVMRVLPTYGDIPTILDFADPGDPNAEYVHPLAGSTVSIVDAVASNDVMLPVDLTRAVPTFAHATVGYVYETDSTTGDITTVGGFVRYYNPLDSVPENKENLLYLDEQQGTIAKYKLSGAFSLTDDIDIQYNPDREFFCDAILLTLEDSEWAPLIVGSAGAGGIADPANGYTSKFWDGFTTTGAYYENFAPGTDTFKSLFTVFGIGRGPYYNDFKIGMTPVNGKPGVYSFTIMTYDDAVGNDIQIGPTYDVSFDPEGQDEFGDSNYIGSVINSHSSFIRIHVNADNVAKAANTYIPGSNEITYLDQALSWLSKFDPAVDLQPVSRSFIELRNGSFGCLYKDNGALNRVMVDNSFVSALKGEYDANVLNIWDNDISLIFDVDYSRAIKEEIQSLCLKRQDCMGVIDLPKSADPAAAVDTRNNALSSINDWCVAIYGNHSYVYSRYEGRDIWVAPSYHLAYLFPMVDKNGEIWDAAAGLKRGKVNIKKTQYNLNDTDYDRWYLNQINPLMTKMNINHIGGQLTAQRYAGPKQNVNIVRMVLFVGKTLRKFGEWYIFDNIIPETLQEIQKEIGNFLEEIKARNGIRAFSAVVSSSDYEMKRKIARAQIELTPVYALEKLLFNINLTQ